MMDSTIYIIFDRAKDLLPSRRLLRNYSSELCCVIGTVSRGVLAVRVCRFSASSSRFGYDFNGDYAKQSSWTKQEVAHDA